MHRDNASFFQREFQIEVEIRCVHADKYIRRITDELLAQLAADTGDFAIMAQHFDVAVHSELFHGKENFHPCRLHLRPANAGETQFGIILPERFDQVAAKQVARSFTRHHGDGFYGMLHEKINELSRARNDSENPPMHEVHDEHQPAPVWLLLPVPAITPTCTKSCRHA